MAYIYKITNQVNGKVYIGKTTENSIEQRWKEHQQDCKKERCKSRPFYRALNKYGLDQFTVEEVEQCDVSVLDERETYWINYYRSYIGWDDCNGYNATLGGDGKCYCDYDWVYSLWQEGKIIKNIAQITKYDQATISKILHNKGITTEEIRQRAMKFRKKSSTKQVKLTSRKEKNERKKRKMTTNKQKPIRYCLICGKQITNSATYCLSCWNKEQQRFERPSRDQLKNDIRSFSLVAVAQKYGVSRSTIARWCIGYNLPDKKRDINSYTATEWYKI